MHIGAEELHRTFEIAGPYVALASVYVTDVLALSEEASGATARSELDQNGSVCVQAIESASVGGTEVRLCASLRPVF